MASLSLLFILFVLGLSAFVVPEHELATSVLALQSRPGYFDFGYALPRSQLHSSLLTYGDTNSSLTLFAPVDHTDFKLGHQIVQRRLSIEALSTIPSGSKLQTLEVDDPIKLKTALDKVHVNRVKISFPRLFYSLSIAVHGLYGVIDRAPYMTPRNPDPPPSSSLPIR